MRAELSDGMRRAGTHDPTRRAYDRLSRWYDVLTLGQENRLRAAALDLLALQPSERVLEVGYGTGSALVPIGDAVGDRGHVWGVDLSPGMARVARRRLRSACCASTIVTACGDVLHLPLLAASMDALFLSFTLELLEGAEIALALAECRRVLRRNGRMGLVCLSSEAGSSRANSLYGWAHARWPAVLDCRPIRPDDWLQASAFEVGPRRRMSLWGLGVEALVCRSR